MIRRSLLSTTLAIVAAALLALHVAARPLIAESPAATGGGDIAGVGTSVGTSLGCTLASD